MTDVLMPALSPTMEEGTLAKWHVKVGDEVRSGDVIAEIETDKATMEVEAIDDGTLGRILVPEGTNDVAVNTPIATILAEGEDRSALAPTAPAPAGDGGVDKPFNVSRAGDVGLHDECIAAGVAQPLLGRSQPAGVPPADRDPGALLDEAIRERRSQPVGPPGDKHDLAIQMQIHGTILAQLPRAGARLRVRAPRCPAPPGRPGGCPRVPARPCSRGRVPGRRARPACAAADPIPAAPA